MSILQVITSPWAIQPEKLLEIQAVYAAHARGERVDIAAVEQRLGRPLANEPKRYDIVYGVAVLPVEWWDPKWITDNIEPKLAGMTGTALTQAEEFLKAFEATRGRTGSGAGRAASTDAECIERGAGDHAGAVPQCGEHVGHGVRGVPGLYLRVAWPQPAGS